MCCDCAPGFWSEFQHAVPVGWGIAALRTETEIFVILAQAIGVDSQAIVVMPPIADKRCELD